MKKGKDASSQGIYIYSSYTTADIFLLAPEGQRGKPEGLWSFERKWSVTVGQRKEGSDRLDVCVVFTLVDVLRIDNNAFCWSMWLEESVDHCCC